MFVVLLAVFIDLVGFGLIVPILPFLTMAYGGDAVMGTALVSTYSLFAFLSGPFWGRLSDRIGRRPALMMTFLGGTLSYATLAFSDSLLMLFLARGMSGAMAGNIGIVMATMADLTTAETRGKAMGWVGAAFALGFAVGPGIAAVLAGISDQTSILLPGLVAAGLSFTALLMTWRFMPETGKINKAASRLDEGLDRSAAQAAKALSPSYETNAGKTKGRQGLDRLRMGLFLAMFVVIAIGQSVNFSITPFWLNAAWGWSLSEVGYMMMGVGLAIAFVQSIALGPLFRTFGEIGTMLLGAFIFTLASIAMWWAEEIPGLLFMTLPCCMVGLTTAFPALNGELSKRTDPALQGSMLGLSNGLAALGRVAGPLAAGSLFAAATPSVPFAVVTCVGAVAISWCCYEKLKGAR